MKVNINNRLVKSFYPAREYRPVAFFCYMALFVIEILFMLAFIVLYGGSVSSGDTARIQEYDWISRAFSTWTFGYAIFMLGSRIGYEQAKKDVASGASH